MTNPLYWLVTITDRRSTDAFLALYESYGVRVSLRTVGAGTAVQEMLATLGLEKSEKAVLFAIITADTWPKIQKALRRQMRDRKSTRLNSSHNLRSRMPSSA